ncbi:MAG: Methylamine utilization protein MauE [Bacteroidetes bacterium]|jgi:hypothetical protein|nr:Methylamine utilization protein MauE [Bacteroidota bacterium]
MPDDNRRVTYGKQSRTGETISGGGMKGITLLSSFAVSGLLAVGAVDKLLHWSPFVFTLQHNPLLPEHLAPAAGGAVITAEMLIAGALLIPRTRHAGLLAATLLFGFFTAVVAVLLVAAPGERCGCTFLFGYDRADVRHLVMNILLTALSGVIWHADVSVLSPSGA